MPRSLLPWGRRAQRGLILVTVLLLTGVPVAADAPAVLATAPAGQRPSDFHRHFDFFVGSWDTHVTLYGPPGSRPVTTEGTAEYRWILDGHYLESVYRGDLGGAPFEGRGLDGFDTATGKYFNVWIDNRRTGLSYGFGHFSADGKSIESFEEVFNPRTRQNEEFRVVLEQVDANTFQNLVLHRLPDGSERQTVKLVGTRRRPLP